MKMQARSDSQLSNILGEVRQAFKANGFVEVDIRTGKRRSDDQNAKMWAMLSDVAKYVPREVDGSLQFLTKDDWKIIFTAGIKKTQRVTRGIEGGFVMLGDSTRNMSKQQLAELIDFIQWFGDENGVKWSYDYEF